MFFFYQIWHQLHTEQILSIFYVEILLLLLHLNLRNQAERCNNTQGLIDFIRVNKQFHLSDFVIRLIDMHASHCQGAMVDRQGCKGMSLNDY